MFSRFGNPQFNKVRWNENRNDSDSIQLKDFTSIGGSAKSVVTVSPTSKSFTPIDDGSGNGRGFIEVAG